MARILPICLLAITLVACTGGGNDDTPPVEITPSVTPSVTATVEIIIPPSATPTLTPTASPTHTPSPTLTIMPTLAVRVLEVTAVMPGLELESVTDSLATSDALPLDEWVRFESDHLALEYLGGEWVEMWSWSAGQNEYRYSVDTDVAVRLAMRRSRPVPGPMPMVWSRSSCCPVRRLI